MTEPISLRPHLDFLLLVGCSAVSPAAQMRFGTSEQARLAGFDDAAIVEIEQTRRTYEDFVRDDIPRELAQAKIDAISGTDWVNFALVPAMLATRSTWGDMDFDPAPVIAELKVPILLIFGIDDWVPVERSIDIWTGNYGAESGLTIVRLTDSGHLPVLGGETRVDPEYESAMLRWLDDRLCPPAAGRVVAKSPQQ